MSMAPKLPAVLQKPCKQPAGMGYQSNSLSVERVLKQAIRLLELYAPIDADEFGQAVIDEINVCLDDLAEMVKSID